MKKILEILQYGETDICFKTDLKPSEKPDTIPGLIAAFSFSMMTSLWGGNELDVMAIIRALAIADLAVSVNREEMIEMIEKPIGNSKRMAARLSGFRQSSSLGKR